MRTEDFQIGVAQSAQKFISATPIFWLLGDIKSSYNQSFNMGGGTSNSGVTVALTILTVTLTVSEKGVALMIGDNLSLK